MKKIKIDWISIVIFLGAIIGTIMVYSKLPSVLPNNFNLDGSYSLMNTTNALLLRFIILLLLVAIGQIPNLLLKMDLDNPRLKTIRFIIRFSLIIIISYHFITVALSLRYEFDSDMYLLFMISLVMIVLGNRFPQLKMNRYFGVRLPWTIRDEDTWRVTHKLMGYTAIPFALIQIVLSFFIELKYALFAGLAMWVIIGILYSLIYYVRKYRC